MLAIASHSNHWGVIISVAATTFLAAVAASGLWIANRQAKVSGDAVEEGRRARIDARAPYVFIETSRPEWPPLVPAPMLGGEPQPLPGDQSFTVPAQDGHHLFMRFPCKLTNHGVAPARVRVEGPVELVYDEAAPSDAGLPEGAMFERLTEVQPVGEFVLPPGEQQELKVNVEAAVRDWRSDPNGLDTTRTVTVTDQFADGIVDTTVIQLHANPLGATPLDAGKFGLRADVAVGGAEPATGHSSVGPTHRDYRRL